MVVASGVLDDRLAQQQRRVNRRNICKHQCCFTLASNWQRDRDNNHDGGGDEEEDDPLVLPQTESFLTNPFLPA